MRNGENGEDGKSETFTFPALQLFQRRTKPARSRECAMVLSMNKVLREKNALAGSTVRSGEKKKKKKTKKGRTSEENKILIGD